MTMYDYRMDARVPTDFPVVMQTPFGNEVLRVINLSHGGMQVVKGRSLLGRRDEVDLRFRLPSGAGPVVCGAEVVYDEGDRPGLRFVGLGPRHAEVMDEYLTDTLADHWFL